MSEGGKIYGVILGPPLHVLSVIAHPANRALLTGGYLRTITPTPTDSLLRRGLLPPIIFYFYHLLLIYSNERKIYTVGIYRVERRLGPVPPPHGAGSVHVLSSLPGSVCVLVSLAG